MFSFVEDFNSI